VPAFVRDTPQAFVDGWREVGDIVRFRGIREMCLLVHPDFVQHVLADRHDNYRRSETVTQALSMLIGDSSFTARGVAWRRRARLVHPLFTSSGIPSFSARVGAAIEAAARRWEPLADSGESFDLYDELRTTYVDAAGRLLVGELDADELERVRAAAVVANEYVIAKTMAVGGPPDIRLRPAYRRYLRAVAALDSWLGAAIAARAAEPQDDLLSALVAARAEDGSQLAPGEVRDEAMTFLHTVYAAVPAALMWFFALLSRHPVAREQLEAELATATAEQAPEPGVLPYLDSATAETLRLYPPLWVFAQVPLAEDEIGGYRIPAGVSVVLSPFITHRHPDFWENAEDFQPERFAGQGAPQRHSYAYFPFSGGPRQCPAGDLALAMIRAGAFGLGRRYRVEHDHGHEIKRRREFVLRPANGLPVSIERLT